MSSKQEQEQEKQEKEKEQFQECTICQEPVIDEIKMTCEAAHSFCFRCIVKDVETHGILKPCPNCRNGLKYILVQNYRSKNNKADISTDPFYTLKYFEDCLPILNKISNQGQKSCLISEVLLQLYVSNKKQLKFAKKHNVDEVFDIIKWSQNYQKPKVNGPAFSFTTVPITRSSDGDTAAGTRDLTDIGIDLLTSFLTNELRGSNSNSGHGSR